MLFTFDNGTQMEVIQANHITSFKRNDGWWHLLDNNMEIREDFPLCNQDIITFKYKEHLAKKLTSLGCSYDMIVKNLKNVI